MSTDVCRQCGKKLKPTYVYRSVRKESLNADGSTGFLTLYELTGEIRGYGYASAGFFCTQTCGWKWAVAQSKHGVTVGMHVTRDQRKAISAQIGKRGEATDKEVAAWIEKAALADLQQVEVDYDDAEEK